MLIATWNVNSLKSRLELLKNWLIDHTPNVVMLQEIKGVADIFPLNDLTALGYHSYYSLQKTYNGVATLSLTPAKIIHSKLPNFEDEQARYLEVAINNIHYINVYVPNGNPTNTPKYTYKLNWLNALYTHIKSLIDNNIQLVLAGDFNIIPYDYDLYSPSSFKDDALYQNEVRKWYFKLLNLGLTDSLDVFYPQQKNRYTWWHYMNGGFAKNKGVRIDHILLSPTLAIKLQSAFIDKSLRFLDKPSDHTLVGIKLQN